MMKPTSLAPLAVAAALAFALVLRGESAAQTPQDTPQLTGDVTDLSQSADAAAPSDGSLRRLEDERNFQLFALFVDSTRPANIADYTDDVVRANGLGAADALLVVAVDDRTYQLWLGDTVAERVSQGEQDSLLANQVEPELRAGRWTAAVSAAADGIRSASGSSGGGGGGGISFGWLVLPLLFIIGLPLLAFWWLRRIVTGASQQGGEARPRAKPQRKLSTEELEAQANTLLLQLDEGVREAEQELAFTEAEGDGDLLDGFKAAIRQAKQHLGCAFELRQVLDDSTPDPPETVRSTLEAVVAECEAGRQLLAEQFTRINERRDYERDAPATLDRLSGDVTALEGRLPAIEQAMGSLRTQADSAWQPVRGNSDEARKRIATAREAIAQGQALLATDRAGAARQARIAQQAIAEGTVLLDAVENLAKQLLEAQAGLAAMLAEAEASMLRASELAASEGRAVPELAQVRSRLQEAREKSAMDPPDLLAAYQLARHADASADELVASLRTAGEEQRRAQAAVETELAAARAAYSRAADYIRGRRGSVGREARTRLAEAQRMLQSAGDLRDSQPQRALEQSRRASRLADEAYALARDDFDDRQTWGSGGMFGGPGGMLGGIILGGMMGDIFGGMSGSGRQGGWGGAGRSIGGVLGGMGGRSRGGRF